MQALPNFEALARLKKYLTSIRLKHASTMEHYCSRDHRGFFHQPRHRSEASRSSTATCVGSLVQSGLWNSNFSLWNDTHRVASKLLARPWKSAGLERNNPFSVSFIIEGVLELQQARPDYRGARDHLRLIRGPAARILLDSFDQGSIKIHPYPPSAYLTQLAYRVLQRLDKVDNDLTRSVHVWSRGEINKQISLISAKSRNADPLNLAYGLILAATTARDETTSPEDKNILSQALALFFQSQYEDGTWPPSRPLFHYSTFGNAYCFEYELLTQLLRCRQLRNELLLYITPYIERTTYRLETAGFDLNNEKPGTATGWPSGHHPQIEGPESWSTASVYSFAYALNGLVAEAIRRVVFEEFGAIYSPPINMQHRGDNFARENFLDADLAIPGKGRVSLRKTIADSFVYPIARDVEAIDKGASFKSTTPMSAILFGPPGTSKTQLAKLISTYLGWPLLTVDPSYLVQEGVDKIQAQANRLFSMLTMSEQIVALLDEFDEMGRDRLQNQELLSRFITTAMLPKLVLINRERKIVFLLATNFISGFDAAFRRPGRFDMLIQVMPPKVSEKLKYWPALRRAYRRLSRRGRTSCRRLLSDLTFLETEQLAKKLMNISAVGEIVAIINAAHGSCILCQQIQGSNRIEGGTWKSQSETETSTIQIPNQ